MTKYKGKDVSVRELKQDDVSFANRFDAAKPQVVIKHIDGREEVVAKDQIDNEGQDQGQTGQAKPGQGGSQGGQGGTGQGRQST
jgi:hypothetical protein